MKKAYIYVGAFLIGILAILGGFYVIPIYKILTPIYKIPICKHAPFGMYTGPILVIIAYFLLGVPPVSIFMKLLLKNNWKRAILTSFAIVLGNIIVLSTFMYFVLHSIGKL
jgi:hypothetical protein